MTTKPPFSPDAAAPPPTPATDDDMPPPHTALSHSSTSLPSHARFHSPPNPHPRSSPLIPKSNVTTTTSPLSSSATSTHTSLPNTATQKRLSSLERSAAISLNILDHLTRLEISGIERARDAQLLALRARIRDVEGRAENRISTLTHAAETRRVVHEVFRGDVALLVGELGDDGKGRRGGVLRKLYRKEDKRREKQFAKVRKG